MGRPTHDYKPSGAAATLLRALVELHDRLPGEEPLIRMHELSDRLGFSERDHARAVLIEEGLVEERHGVFDRGFSECVLLVRRGEAGKALRRSGIKVPEPAGAPLEAGPLSRPSSLAS